jgi:phage major head subunit gpT-like protein
MMSFKNVDGRPLGILPNLMVVPPSLEEQGREILQADFIMKLAMEGTTGVAAAVRNVWQKTADLLVAPELS